MGLLCSPRFLAPSYHILVPRIAVLVCPETVFLSRWMLSVCAGVLGTLLPCFPSPRWSSATSCAQPFFKGSTWCFGRFSWWEQKQPAARCEELQVASWGSFLAIPGDIFRLFLGQQQPVLLLTLLHSPPWYWHFAPQTDGGFDLLHLCLSSWCNPASFFQLVGDPMTRRPELSNARSLPS
ncbi:UNVERIFIED_CONTAM: hypothetical protein Sradi_4429000 [Sesamum radiatum]|uniref:Uncharacterized protein n=1 Tax=Sesamum radiatum TaxID=300843 RepID=A0AAW2NQ37_SESRA